MFARELAPKRAANFGIGGDSTQHVLWRVKNGEMDGIKPRALMLMVGTNNMVANTPGQIAAGVKAIIDGVRRARARLGPAVPIIAGGGVHERAHVLELEQAGANLVQLDTGLVFSGPGLPKRVNEVELWEATRGAPPVPAVRWPEATWFWIALMGAGMLVGSLMAVGIAVADVAILATDRHLPAAVCNLIMRETFYAPR